MITEATEKDRQRFDELARHPLQSWAWGEFRKLTGVKLTRLIQKKNEGSEEVFQITWHKIPKINKYIGYCPKSAIPDEEATAQIARIAKKRGAIFVKFEPNEEVCEDSKNKIGVLEGKNVFRPGKPLFTKFSFWLDISPSEDALLAKMQQKTRYNVRLAEKRGVRIVEDDSEIGFEDYWRLTEETTKRQGFYSHTKNYHRRMWKTMTDSGMGHIFKAVYEGKILATWVVFCLNGILYYPYGASSNLHREVMASNLMMWEVIRFGKKQKCKLFDLWGSLGPDPDITDPWYGFHRFKQGYGAQLVEFVGTYDMVVDERLYVVYNFADKLRWMFLKFAAGFKK